MGFVACLAAAFLLGGIPFGLLVGYLAGRGDIRAQGSGNIGAANVWRVVGPAAALVTFAGDIGKGFMAVYLAHWMYQPSWPMAVAIAAPAAGTAAILGHVCSPYLRFRGGKGVNTALGVFAALLPLEVAAGLAAFLIIMILFRYVSLGSMAGAVAFVAAVWIRRFESPEAVAPFYLAVASLAGLLILFTHRQNLKRLTAGTEPRFRWRKASV